MYKNWEDLFNSIKGEWNYNECKIQHFTVILNNYYWVKVKITFIENNGNVCTGNVSLADIFDDKEKNNACECLAKICFQKNPTKWCNHYQCYESKSYKKCFEKCSAISRVAKEIESKLRQKIFESVDKLEAINNFMRG